MLHIALFEPEIAPNTGNIIRLAANSGCYLHLIEPLGFDLEEKKLRRAGLDYRDLAQVRRHADYAAFIDHIGRRRLFFCTTKARQYYHQPTYRDEDVFVFGPESRGLPDSLLQQAADARKIRIPMQAGSRSLNLANAVAIICYEAWRQLDFAGAC